MTVFKKIFLATFIFTAASWSAAWVCLAVAGESPSVTAKKLGSRLNQGTWADEKETLDFAGVENLTVEAAAADVTIEKVTGDGKISVEYSGIVKPGGKILRVQREGNTLKVSLDPNRENSVAFFLTDDDDEVEGRNHATAKGLRISVPADLAKLLRIDVQSGDVKLKNLNAGEIQIKSVSGEIEVIACGARNKAAIASVSGEIEIKDFNGELATTSTSGEIEVERINGGGFVGNSISGDISVKMPDAAGWKFALATTSGEIKNEYSDDVKANKTMQLRSTSGDIRVRR